MVLKQHGICPWRVTVRMIVRIILIRPIMPTHDEAVQGDVSFTRTHFEAPDERIGANQNG
jgi:hypothetical protein